MSTKGRSDDGVQFVDAGARGWVPRQHEKSSRRQDPRLRPRNNIGGTRTRSHIRVQHMSKQTKEMRGTDSQERRQVRGVTEQAAAEALIIPGGKLPADRVQAQSVQGEIRLPSQAQWVQG